MEKKTVQLQDKKTIIKKYKKSRRIKRPKTKTNKFAPANKNPSLIIQVSPGRSLASSQ